MIVFSWVHAAGEAYTTQVNGVPIMSFYPGKRIGFQIRWR